MSIDDAIAEIVNAVYRYAATTTSHLEPGMGLVPFGRGIADQIQASILAHHRGRANRQRNSESA